MRALKRRESRQALHSELLILPDGRIMAHNLTVEMAKILQFLAPGDDSMDQRIPGNPNSSSAKTS
jgi:hypothetical protein